MSEIELTKRRLAQFAAVFRAWAATPAPKSKSKQVLRYRKWLDLTDKAGTLAGELGAAGLLPVDARPAIEVYTGKRKPKPANRPPCPLNLLHDLVAALLPERADRPRAFKPGDPINEQPREVVEDFFDDLHACEPLDFAALCDRLAELTEAAGKPADSRRIETLAAGLDAKGRQIVLALHKRGRLTIEGLAGEAGVSEATIKRRLSDELRAAGITSNTGSGEVVTELGTKVAEALLNKKIQP